MTTTRTKKSLQELISRAGKEYSFIRVALFETEKDGKKKTSLGRKPNVPISGAPTQWAKRDFSYWPEVRLAGGNWENLISYACINQLPVGIGSKGERSRMKSGKSYTLGPFIGYDANASGAGAFMVKVKIAESKTGTLEESEAQYVDDAKISTYSYKYTAGSEKGDPGVIRIDMGKPTYSPDGFIAHEKEMHSSFNKTQKEAANEAADLEALNMHILTHKIPSKSGKSSKSGESKRVATTWQSFSGSAFKKRVTEQAESEKAKSNNPDDYWLDISNLSEKLTGSRLIVNTKLNDKHIRIAGTRIVFNENSSNRGGAVWYFRAKNGWNPDASDEDNGEAGKAARREMRTVVADNERPPLTGKKSSDSSGEESKKKSPKKKGKKPASSAEEEASSAEEESS
jgi:hypothetical protein